MKQRALIFFAALALVFVAAPARAFPEYYALADRAKAESEAKQRHLPLAWLCSLDGVLQSKEARLEFAREMTDLTIATLKDRAVIIYFDTNHTYRVPVLITRAVHAFDADNLAYNTWYIPKVIFTDPDTTKVLAVVTAGQLGEKREAHLISALHIIANDRHAFELAPPPVVPQVVRNQPSDPPKNPGELQGLTFGFVLLIGFGLYFVWRASLKRM